MLDNVMQAVVTVYLVMIKRAAVYLLATGVLQGCGLIVAS